MTGTVPCHTIPNITRDAIINTSENHDGSAEVFLFYFLRNLQNILPSYHNGLECRCTGRLSMGGWRRSSSHEPPTNSKRIRSDALQAFLKVLTFAYSFFYLIMQYELQCIKFPQ